MKKVLKVFVLVLIVLCMVVSCSKKAGSSNNADGSEVIVSSNDGSNGSSGGSSSAAAVSSDNSLKNVVGKIEHGKDDIIFNNWAGIPWTDFGLSAVPAEPLGGKFETAFLRADKLPYIFISNVSKAAYESLCREMEDKFNKEGSINSDQAYDWYLRRLDFDHFDDCYEISLGYSYEIVDFYQGDRVDTDSTLTTIYTFRVYHYDSPVNGVVMTLFSESIR